MNLINLQSKYNPTSKENHYKQLKNLIDASKTLPTGKYKYEHLIVDNVYIRSLKLSRNTLAVGVIHKKETVLIMLKGSVRLFNEDGMHVLKQGTMVVSKPGTQRAAMALEDCELITIHNTNTIDLPEIVSSITDYNLEEVSGVDEGKYKVFINGRMIKDEEIKPTRSNFIENGGLQRLLSNRNVSKEPTA